MPLSWVGSDSELVVELRLPSRVEASGKQSSGTASSWVMASLVSDTTLPLTLSEQLNAMLAGWLERHAPDGDFGRSGQRAAGVITVADSDVA
jgi:hypothetical protein